MKLRRWYSIYSQQTIRKNCADVMPCEIRYVDFGNGGFGIQGGIRPALITQNEIGCKASPIIVVTPLTTNLDKARFPINVFIPRTEANGLKYDSVALANQMRPVHRDNIGDCIGIIEAEHYYRCCQAVMLNMGLAA